MGRLAPEAVAVKCDVVRTCANMCEYVRIPCEYRANIVRICANLCEYRVNTVRILCEFRANTANMVRIRENMMRIREEHRSP